MTTDAAVLNLPEATSSSIAGGDQPVGSVPFVVPYSRLFLSPRNVRSAKEPNPGGIARLAATIHAVGLLSDLHVSPELKNGQPTGRFGVEAGGRRWRALGLLIEQGKLPADAPIACRGVEAGAATATSLIENISQEPMHPADEFVAFAQMAKDGAAPEAIAARFGVTVVHVLRRMKLAAVAPMLFELYRQDKVTLDQMMALAAVDDHKRQIAAWKALPEYSRSPIQIKRKLLEEEVAVDDARAKLVGLERYEACGGTLRRDLFTDEVFLADPGLLDLIVAEVLTEKADAVRREGYAWVETLVSMGYEEHHRFQSPPARMLPESPEHAAQRQALDEAFERAEAALDTSYERDDNSQEARDEQTRLRGECNRIAAERRALAAQLVDKAGWPKAEIGAVVTNDGGKLQVIRGVVTADMARRMRKAIDGTTAQDDAGGSKSEGREEYPERLMRDLTAHRTAALQAAMIGNRRVSLAAIACRLAQLVIVSARYLASPLTITAPSTVERAASLASGFGNSRAARVIEDERTRLLAVLRDAPEATWFDLLLTQEESFLLDLIVFCSACTVDVMQARAGARDDVAALERALNLDMADWWSATPETLLAAIPKAKLIGAVTEAVGAEGARGMDKLKKPEAVVHAAAMLAGTRWLPTPLRAPSA